MNHGVAGSPASPHAPISSLSWHFDDEGADWRPVRGATMNRNPQSKVMVMTNHKSLVALCGLLLATAACPASVEDVRPPADEFFFPTGMVLSPDQSLLFVSNGNSELRHDSGTINVVSLDSVEALIDNWLASERQDPPANCGQDAVLPGVLQCHEQTVINADSGARIGNFSTALGVQELASGDLRLFAAVRGDPSITWIDFSAATGRLSCNDNPDDRFPLCSGEHRMLYLRDNVELSTLIGEPFGVYVDSGNGFAMVTHLSQGAVTLIDAPTDGRPPVMADALAGLFQFNVDSQTRAALGIAGRRPGAVNDLIYVASRSEPRVIMLTVYRNSSGVAAIAPAEYFFLDGIDPSDDSRGIAFNEDGSRLYVINRAPAFLHVYDTEDGPDGFPRNAFAGGVELCTDASNIAVADLGRGDRVYVSCFPNGQIWVVDPRAQIVESIVDVGRGPNAVALAPERGLLFVGNFLGGTVSVVDVRPGSPNENRVLLRLGGRDADK